MESTHIIFAFKLFVSKGIGEVFQAMHRTWHLRILVETAEDWHLTYDHDPFAQPQKDSIRMHHTIRWFVSWCGIMDESMMTNVNIIHYDYDR